MKKKCCIIFNSRKNNKKNMCIRRQIKAISTIKMADKVISCARKPIFCFITSASAKIWQDVGGTTFNAPFFHWLAPGIPSWLAESLARVCECDNKDIIIYENTSQSQDSQRNECEVIVGKHVNTPWRCGELCTARHVGELRLMTEAHDWGSRPRPTTEAHDWGSRLRLVEACSAQTAMMWVSCKVRHVTWWRSGEGWDVLLPSPSPICRRDG